MILNSHGLKKKNVQNKSHVYTFKAQGILIFIFLLISLIHITVQISIIQNLPRPTLEYMVRIKNSFLDIL